MSRMKRRGRGKVRRLDRALRAVTAGWRLEAGGWRKGHDREPRAASHEPRATRPDLNSQLSTLKPQPCGYGPLLEAFFAALYSAWGPQHWWPGKTPFEVMVGAVLTQNTSWTNVEKAIAQLKAQGMLDPLALYHAPTEQVAGLIRSSGYYNLKARRLKNLIAFLFQEAGGSVKRLRAMPTRELRAKLLAVNGLGPETVDSILLYALDRPVFVIDAYTRRVLRRHGVVRDNEGYEEVRALFETNLPRNRTRYNEYHALLVRAGKLHCRPRACCDGCPLAAFPHVV